MQSFSDLYAFLEFARHNRKYPESTANNLKSALKIFEKNLTEEEAVSLSLVEDRIDEIFMGVISANKDKSIGSLNTYKARVQKVLNDFKRYGADPVKLQNWQVKQRVSTPLLNKKDKQDKVLSGLSVPPHTPVDNTLANHNTHKIDLALSSGHAIITLPKTLTQKDADLIKNIVNNLSNKKV